MLDYNITNPFKLLLDNNKENITLKKSNNSNLKRIKPADIDNDKKDIRSVDIDKQRLVTLH